MPDELKIKSTLPTHITFIADEFYINKKGAKLEFKGEPLDLEHSEGLTFVQAGKTYIFKKQ
jgi:hypothetical protein